ARLLIGVIERLPETAAMRDERIAPIDQPLDEVMDHADLRDLRRLLRELAANLGFELVQALAHLLANLLPHFEKHRLDRVEEVPRDVVRRRHAAHRANLRRASAASALFTSSGEGVPGGGATPGGSETLPSI